MMNSKKARQFPDEKLRCEAYSLLHWSYPRDMRRLLAKQAAKEADKALWGKVWIRQKNDLRKEGWVDQI